MDHTRTILLSGAPNARTSRRMERTDPRDVDATLARLDAISRVLDSAVRIPGTDFRVGLDALIGLVPVVGDLVTKAVSGYVILEARRLGASRWTIARMAANTTLDAIVGMVPIVGDAFDVMYRANAKNIALLRRHLERNSVVAGGTTIDGYAERIG